MKNEDAVFAAGFLLGFVTVLFLCVIFFIIRPNYKDGQIDAINGVIKYELQVQHDGSTDWEKVSE